VRPRRNGCGLPRVPVSDGGLESAASGVNRRAPDGHGPVRSQSSCCRPRLWKQVIQVVQAKPSGQMLLQLLDSTSARPHQFPRQRNTWLGAIPCLRAPADTDAPAVPVTTASFSARDHLRCVFATTTKRISGSYPDIGTALYPSVTSVTHDMASSHYLQAGQGGWGRRLTAARRQAQTQNPPIICGSAGMARFLKKGVCFCLSQAWQRPTLPRLKTKYHWRWSV
jgi:hypothetical protein